jgi:hypothetical protein
LRAEHPLEIDSEVWWDAKKEQITSKYCRSYSLMEVWRSSVHCSSDFHFQNIRSLLPFRYENPSLGT